MQSALTLWNRLVKFGFRLLYNEMAFTYDSVSWLVSLGEWRDWCGAALRHVNAPPGALILELAHGTANLQSAMRRAGFNPVGIDLSPAMGRIARRKLSRAGFPLQLARARAQALPFGDQTFVALVSTFPTEFILDPRTLAESHRVLTPGGRLVIVPNATFTKGGLAREGLELAYRVTGQRAPLPPGILERFEGAGFGVRLEQESFRRSTAQVFIAEKH